MDVPFSTAESSYYIPALLGFGIGLPLGWVLKGRIANPLNFLRTVAAPIIMGNRPKLVFVVRTDLGMKKGKVASQCAHAAVACYKKALSVQPDIVKQWELLGQPKIILKLEDNVLLKEVRDQATKKGLVTSLIADAGRTQVKPGEVTVLGIGPGRSELIDSIVGHMRLY